jgi:hypothetical protein
MSEYSFYMPVEEIRKNKQCMMAKGCEMHSQEGIFVAWETDYDALRRVVPPCFEVPGNVVCSYIICMPDNNITQEYNEAALQIPVIYNGVPGIWFRSHFLAGPGAPMGCFIGRELGGFSKKVAEDMTIRRAGDMVNAYFIKDGEKILDIHAKLNGQYNTEDGANLFARNATLEKNMGTMFFIKFELEEYEDGHCGFEHGRIVSNYADTQYTSWEPATVTVDLKSTPNAPWAELEVKRVLGGGYGMFQCIDSSCKVEGLVDAKELEPYMMVSHYDRGIYGEPFSAREMSYAYKY